jgi:hypothetical protein
MPGYGRPQLVHSPHLVARSDGRYEVHCQNCRSRAEEAIPIGIGLPVASRIEALEMLRNHLGPAARRTGSQVLPDHGPRRPDTLRKPPQRPVQRAEAPEVGFGADPPSPTIRRQISL